MTGAISKKDIAVLAGRNRVRNILLRILIQNIVLFKEMAVHKLGRHQGNRICKQLQP